MSDDTTARAAEVLIAELHFGYYDAEDAVRTLAAAGLLATTPAPEVAALIKAAIAWRTQPLDSRLKLGQLATTVDAYLAAHPEAQP